MLFILFASLDKKLMSLFLFNTRPNEQTIQTPTGTYIHSIFNTISSVKYTQLLVTNSSLNKNN